MSQNFNAPPKPEFSGIMDTVGRIEKQSVSLDRSAMQKDTADSFERMAVRHGEYRLVRNRHRKRRLKKRGEDIWWSPQFECWVWDFAKLPF